jgi:Ca2+-binding EF-hand superfamily protein
MRWFYILLLRMHPRSFRQRFGDEMLGIFDQSGEKVSLMADGFLSLARQRTLRQPSFAFSPTTAPDGVPLFYSAEAEIPSARALMRGVLVAFLAFVLFSAVMSHRWRQTYLIVGSHHPSPSHLLGAHTDAQPVADLPAEVKVNPYPFHPPISPYFRFLLVLGALDVDQDNVISAEEIENAPAALWKLDKNHDGQLTAEECGLKSDPNLDPLKLGSVRLTFMRVHPVLAALDANHDGVISESEIRNAAAALRTLDANHDGKLVERELLPDQAIAMAAGIMGMLDKNGDGRITKDERRGPFAADILDRADRDGKGYVTEEDLVIAIRSSPAARP